MRYIHLRLTAKPSERLHGLDLSRARVGGIVVVTPHSAVQLIAEGCAVEAQPSPVVASRVVYPPSRLVAS
ncbi:MAG TPA: hypothetical protein VM115_03150 [Vicinamibacterales bacterium]|nr:hypothetical protein [Vicinamibacterales bacterium]